MGNVYLYTPDEANRVINHSNYTREYWALLRDIFEVKRNGQSHGAALNRLITSLRLGGEHNKNGGTEFDSGHNANTGIVEFSHWLNTLEEKERDGFLELTASNVPTGMGELWARLTRPKDEQYQNVMFCVELIADDLQSVLNEHPKLYNLQPDCENRRNEARKELLVNLERIGYPVTFNYPKKTVKKLIEGLFAPERINDTFVLLPDDENRFDFIADIFHHEYDGNIKSFIRDFGPWFKFCIKSCQDFLDMIKSLSTIKDIDYIALSKEFDIPFIKTLIRDESDLGNLILSLPVVDQLDEIFMKNKISSLFKLNNILELASSEDRLRVLTEIIGIKITKSVITSSVDLANLLRLLHEIDRPNLIKTLGTSFVKNLIHSSEDIAKVAATLGKQSSALLDSLDQKFVANHLTHTSLCILLNALPKENHTSFFDAYIAVLVRDGSFKKTLSIIDRYKFDKVMYKQIMLSFNRCYQIQQKKRSPIRFSSLQTFFGTAPKQKIEASIALESAAIDGESKASLDKYTKALSRGELHEIAIRLRS